MESAPERRSVFDTGHHLQGEMRWVSATNSPTLCTRNLVGLMSSTASRHRSKSLSVGSSRGHRMVERFTPCGRRSSTEGSIIRPEAERISDKKIIWRCRRTLLSRHSVSRLCPLSQNTSMRNLSPLRGNRNDKSAVCMTMSNLSTFSHSIFIHECVAKKENHRYELCRG